MFIESYQFERLLNYFGLLHNTFQEKQISISPKDVVFKFTVEKNNMSVKILNYSEGDAVKNPKLQAAFKEVRRTINSFDHYDEYQKIKVFDDMSPIDNDFLPVDQQYEIKGRFLNDLGEKAEINLLDSKNHLILGVFVELPLIKSSLSDFFQIVEEDIQQNQKDYENVEIDLIFLINVDVDESNLNLSKEERLKNEILTKFAPEIFSLIKDKKVCQGIIHLFFENFLDPLKDNTVFKSISSSKGINCFEFLKSQRVLAKREFKDFSKAFVIKSLSKLKPQYYANFQKKVSEALKTIRKFYKNLNSLSYYPSYSYSYSLTANINETWDDFEIRDVTSLVIKGEVRTPDYIKLKKAYDMIDLNKKISLNEIEVFSFYPKLDCSNCKKKIGAQDYLYYCYWCQISFCIDCVEDKIRDNGSAREKYIHKEHNLLYFKTKDPENMKDLDKYRLGTNKMAEVTDDSLSFYHSACCNGCGSGFKEGLPMCQRYVCITCRAGIYRDTGFNDFCFRCIRALREGKNDAPIRESCSEHDDPKHIQLMLITQCSSYRDY